MLFVFVLGNHDLSLKNVVEINGAEAGMKGRALTYSSYMMMKVKEMRKWVSLRCFWKKKKKSTFTSSKLHTSSMPN